MTAARSTAVGTPEPSSSVADLVARPQVRGQLAGRHPGRHEAAEVDDPPDAGVARCVGEGPRGVAVGLARSPPVPSAWMR